MASNQRLLNFFPTIREDESIYSICARFHQLSGYLRPEVTSNLLLGHCHGGTRQDMQVGLAHLLQVSGGAFESIPEMLRTRTVLRAYLPLMSSLRRAAIIRTCSQPWSVDTTRATAGLTWNKVTTYHELRICTECADRQRRELGSCYWLNSHQLPGVWVCLEHGGSLSVVPRRGRRIREWISAENAWSTLNHGSINPVSLNRFRQLAACVNWIGSNESLTFEVLAAMIRSRLRLAGFARSDVKMTTAELERLNSAEISPLVSSGAPHFAALGNPVWISSSLKDRLTAHPVKLAALLSIAGECNFRQSDQ